MSKKKEYVGLELGFIKIVEELNKKNGHRYFLLKCSECGNKKRIGQSQLASGNYNVCEHDAL